MYTLCYALTYAAQVADIKATKLKKGPFGFFDRKLVEVFLKAIQKRIPGPLWNVIPHEKLEELIDRYSYASSEDFLNQRKVVNDKMKLYGDGFDIILPDVLNFKGKDD